MGCIVVVVADGVEEDAKNVANVGRVVTDVALVAMVRMVVVLIPGDFVTIVVGSVAVNPANFLMMAGAIVVAGL